jgi:hypothetical protein
MLVFLNRSARGSALADRQETAEAASFAGAFTGD